MYEYRRLMYVVTFMVLIALAFAALMYLPPLLKETLIGEKIDQSFTCKTVLCFSGNHTEKHSDTNIGFAMTGEGVVPVIGSGGTETETVCDYYTVMVDESDVPYLLTYEDYPLYIYMQGVEEFVLCKKATNFSYTYSVNEYTVKDVKKLTEDELNVYAGMITNNNVF